jgi:2-oxoisovalerate dehydrogenase E1 component
VEAGYRSLEQIRQDEGNDPLLHSVRVMAELGVMEPAVALETYDAIGAEVAAQSEVAASRPRLQTSGDVMQSLIPPARTNTPRNGPSAEDRIAAFDGEIAQLHTPQTLAKLINWTLTDLMLEHGEVFLAGEDVGRKGGVYGVTQKLQSRFGPGRVIDTLLDEQSILGLAIGAAQNGFVPIPEIQFLAYLHNAEDQLRGEAATLPFFSNGQFTNPMVVRIAGLGYQRGFGGHFHNDNSLAVLRDIPGLVVGVPSDGAEAAAMLREAVRLAREEQRVSVLVEPIALYHTRDLHPGDGKWLRRYDPTAAAPLGSVAVHGDGNDLAVITYGNGRYLSAQALGERDNVRIIDLRWLAPLPFDALAEALEGVKRVLIVDECRRSGNVSEALMTWLSERGVLRILRITAADSFIATGPAYAATLPSAAGILQAAQALLEMD